MNKQEAIEYIENGDTLTIEDKRNDSLIDMVIKSDVLAIISQIDEPKKVLIPQFVADKIEYFIDTEGYELFHAMDYCYNYKDSAEWLEANEETFARAWLDGYEIEQEKLYTVQIPDPNADGYSIVLGRSEGKVQIKQTLSTTWEMNCSNQLTEAEIKQDFGWAWNAGFAKEV